MNTNGHRCSRIPPFGLHVFGASGAEALGPGILAAHPFLSVFICVHLWFPVVLPKPVHKFHVFLPKPMKDSALFVCYVLDAIDTSLIEPSECITLLGRRDARSGCSEPKSP